MAFTLPTAQCRSSRRRHVRVTGRWTRFLKAPNEDFAMARVLPTGALDTSFGTNGVVVTPFPGHNAMATAVGLQADGNIVVAGTSDGQLAVARYLGQ